MKRAFHLIPFAVLCLLLLWRSGRGGEPNDVSPERALVKAAVVVCTGTIDNGLFKSIQRRTETAVEAGASYVIYEIGTYGGMVEAADEIAKYFILDVGKRVRTVAYVKTEAISAGAMISVSCQDIIMRENTTIGDCAPIALGGTLEGVEREKAESFIRAAFVRAAEANGYPAPLLKAMVTMQTEVYRVRNLQTNEWEYFETDDLPGDPNAYDVDGKERIVKDDELLTLTASQAAEYGVARKVVKDRGEALAFLAERDAVLFEAEPIVLRTNWSEEMVRWLNSPAVMAVLVMLAMLGVYIEFSTPGLGLPGLVAVICFALIVGSKYLIGLANWVEVAIFLIGIILLLVEFLILPGFGIAGTLGIVCLLAGLFGMLIKNPPDKLPWPETSLDWQIFTDGVLGMAFGFVAFVVLAWVLSKYLPRLQFLSGLILTPSAAAAGSAPVSMTVPAGDQTVSLKVGDVGEVVSPLRPAGRARFGDAIVDVVAVADFIENGQRVEITEIRGNRVVVRQAGQQ